MEIPIFAKNKGNNVVEFTDMYKSRATLTTVKIDEKDNKKDYKCDRLSRTYFLSGYHLATAKV